MLPLVSAICGPAGNSRRTDIWLFVASTLTAVGLQILIDGAEWRAARALGQPSYELAMYTVLYIPRPPLHVSSVASPLIFTSILATLVGVALAMRRRTGVDRDLLVACIACGALFQLGLLLCVVCLAILIRPDRLRRHLLAGFVFMATSAAVWTAHTAAVTSAQASVRLFAGLTMSSLAYPLDGFRHVGQHLPLSSLTALAMAALASFGVQSRSRLETRILCAALAVNLISVGVLGVDVRARYFLLLCPILFLICAGGLQTFGALAASVVHGLVRAPRAVASTIGAVVALVLMTALLVEQHGYLVEAGRASSAPQPTWLTRFLPATGSRWDRDSFPTKIDPDDILICNDDLACLYLVGRVDYWLLTDPPLIERYSVQNVPRRAIYSRSPVITSREALQLVVNGRNGRHVQLVVLDTGKFGYQEPQAMAMALVGQSGGSVLLRGNDTTVVRIGTEVSETRGDSRRAPLDPR